MSRSWTYGLNYWLQQRILRYVRSNQLYRMYVPSGEAFAPPFFGSRRRASARAVTSVFRHIAIEYCYIQD